MISHVFETRDLAEAYVAALGFTHEPRSDVWNGSDGHQIAYVVRDGAVFSVTITVNRTDLPVLRISAPRPGPATSARAH
jgi:hypothetical protein